MSVDEIFDEVMKDKVFYDNSGGGVTLSGGEPLLQIDFCLEISKMLKDAGVNVAIETAGNVEFENISKIIPDVNLWLYDVKFFDEKKHIEWTGFSNKTILENLNKLVDSTNAEIIIRVPLIPDVNDGEEFERIVDFVSKFEKINELHILPFHQIGSSKFLDLGMDYEMQDHREENDENINKAKKYAETKGLRVSVGGGGY